MIGATYKKFAYKGNIYPKYIKSVIYAISNNDKIDTETSEINKFIEMCDYMVDLYYNDEYYLDYDEYRTQRNGKRRLI